MHIGVALRAGKPAAFRNAQEGKQRTAAAGGQRGIGEEYRALARGSKRMLSWHNVALPLVAPVVCTLLNASLGRAPLRSARAGKATMCKAICALRLARATIQSACNQ